MSTTATIPPGVQTLLLTPDHLHGLTVTRGIALDVVKERGYQSLLQPEDLIDRGFSKSQAKVAPVLGIPLWDVHGQRHGWVMRPDAPRQFPNDKVGKYEQAKGSRLILDVHPRMRSQIGDPQTQLWITEGVPKGDSLTSRGACAIALAGVNGFKGSNEHGGKVILPDWDYVALNGREVIVVYDSDIYQKPDVDRALKSLYTFLRSRQAVPRLVQWPESYRTTKWGVDDFLAQGHTVQDLLAMVPPQRPLSPRVTANGHGAPPEPPPATAPSGFKEEHYPYGDAYNAQRLVRTHGQEMRYCTHWQSWLTWTGTHWERDTTGLMMRWQRDTVMALSAHLASLGDDAAKELLAHIKTSLSTSRLKASVEQAHTWEGISVGSAAFDADPWLLNCTNGTLDLRTGILRSHQQQDMLTKCLSIPYDPEARCPQWVAFLEKAMDGNAELMVFLQRALGYSLTGSTREQCFFLLHGPTKTGKSTFVNIAKALLGPYGTQAEMSTFLHKDRETVRNDLADLVGMRLVAAIETDEDKRLAQALIKQLTGGTDAIKARFLFEEYFEYRPQFKVFLGTNWKPKVNAADDALWERVRLVPFVVQIPKDQRDKELENKLRDELPGILAWAVRGCLAWQRDDSLTEPAAVVAATQQYRDEMDTLGQFIEECCVVGAPEIAKVKAPLLASAYAAWCKRTGNPPMSNRALIAALEQRNYERKPGHANQLYWHGLGLADPGDERHSKD